MEKRSLKNLFFAVSLFFSADCFSQIEPIGGSKVLYTRYEYEDFEEMKIFFDGEFDKPGHFTFESADNQTIYVHKDRMFLLGSQLERAINKAIQWDSIAKLNHVENLEKKLGIQFQTNGGMIHDVNYKTCGPSIGNFKVEFFTMEGSRHSYVTFEVFQTESIYSSFWSRGMSFDVNNQDDLKRARELVKVLKNSNTIANKIRKESSTNLFK